MAFELVGTIQLVDQMSAPLRNVSGALGRLSNAAKSPTSGLRDFANAGNSAGSMGGSFNANLQGMVKTLGKVATAIGVTKIAMDTVHKAMEFDSKMAGISSLGPEVKDARKDLEALALQMSVGSKYSAIEAAEGIDNLIRAGRTVEQVMAGDLSAAMAMAAADDISLADAAEIVSDNMNAFSKNGLAAADVANILAGASAASSTDIAGIQMGLKNVGSVASSVNMSLLDTASALGLMANNGIKGSDAGTALKTMLMRLQPKGGKATKMMKELGIMTKKGENRFYDASGQLKSMAEISGILQTSMSGLTDQQRAYAMETMFGTDAIRAANILFEAGSEGVLAFQDAMSQTTAFQMAADKLDSASGAADILRGILSTLQIVIGQALLPVIKDFCKWAADAATKIIEWFQSVEGQETLQNLADGFKTVLEKVQSFCAWLGIVLSPLFNRIKTDIGNVVTALQDWLSSDEGAAWFNNMKAAAEGVIEGITAVYTFFSDNFSTIAPIIAGITAGIIAFNIATGIMGIVTAVNAAGGLAAAAASCWAFTAALLANPITWIVIAVIALVAVLVYLWMNWDQISAWLSASWDTIKAKASEIFGGIATFLSETWTSITEGVTTAWTNVQTAITTAWDTVTAFFEGIDLSTIGTTIINTLLTGISTTMGTITSTVSGLWDSTKAFFDGISLSDIGKNIIDGLLSGLKNAWASVTSWFSNAANSIPGWVKDALGIHSPSRVMMELGEFTSKGFAIGLENERDSVDDAAVNLAETPLSAMQRTGSDAESAAPAVGAPADAQSAAQKVISFQFGDIILQGVAGDLKAAADEFMAIIAEKLSTDGSMVPEVG